MKNQSVVSSLFLLAIGASAFATPATQVYSQTIDLTKSGVPNLTLGLQYEQWTGTLESISCVVTEPVTGPASLYIEVIANNVAERVPVGQYQTTNVWNQPYAYVGNGSQVRDYFSLADPIPYVDGALDVLFVNAGTAASGKLLCSAVVRSN